MANDVRAEVEVIGRIKWRTGEEETPNVYLVISDDTTRVPLIFANSFENLKKELNVEDPRELINALCADNTENSDYLINRIIDREGYYLDGSYISVSKEKYGEITNEEFELTTYDSVTFKVPRYFLIEASQELFSISFTDFLKEYDWDMAKSVYDKAIEEEIISSDEDIEYKGMIKNISKNMWLKTENNGAIELTDNEGEALVFYEDYVAIAILEMLNDTQSDCYTLFDNTSKDEE